MLFFPHKGYSNTLTFRVQESKCSFFKKISEIFLIILMNVSLLTKRVISLVHKCTYPTKKCKKTRKNPCLLASILNASQDISFPQTDQKSECLKTPVFAHNLLVGKGIPLVLIRLAQS